MAFTNSTERNTSNRSQSTLRSRSNKNIILNSQAQAYYYTNSRPTFRLHNNHLRLRPWLICLRLAARADFDSKVNFTL